MHRSRGYVNECSISSVIWKKKNKAIRHYHFILIMTNKNKYINTKTENNK
jgi:hypothetical protein